jgi:hypothetical protein
LNPAHIVPFIGLISLEYFGLSVKKKMPGAIAIERIQGFQGSSC